MAAGERQVPVRTVIRCSVSRKVYWEDSFSGEGRWLVGRRPVFMRVNNGAEGCISVSLRVDLIKYKQRTARK